MQGDDPPYLQVGTAVSAKYKGAFCEAKVSKVVRVVKCKVTYKSGLGNTTVSDEQIRGTLRVGQLVQIKHPDRKEFVDGTITKIQDCSQYTVVFDDGDITTLRRSALCLKSGRHFNESETLDQLPLTHPEHFGNPVMGGRRGRRSRQLKEESSEDEGEEENEPDLEMYSVDTGKVVCVESGDKKRNKDNWFPGLIVMPSAQPTVRINVKDEFLIRSFKDGRYYTVPKKEVSDFKREMGARVESSPLAEAVEKANKFLDHDELPVHWERSTLFNLSQYSDSDENYSDSSDDEPTEEKDHFVAQLYKFMDDSGTPLNKTPTVAGKDVDFYRLFRLVQKQGGYNRITNQNKWKSITVRLKFPQSQNASNQVKQVYKKCLLSYESFYRTLGCTMLNPTRNAKKNRGRSLIRDKDRVTPVQSPRPEKEEEEKKEDEGKGKKMIKVEDKKKDVATESSSDNSSDATDLSEVPSTSKEVGRPKRNEAKLKDKKPPPAPPPPPKLEKVVKEEPVKKEEEKVQQTRSKTQPPRNQKDITSPELKEPIRETPAKPAPKAPVIKKPVIEEDKKRNSRKKLNADDKTSNSDSSMPEAAATPGQGLVNVGDKLKVYYGPTHESKVTYEAKVVNIDTDAKGYIRYLVHYTGWNTRYDEWINFARIAENLSATVKAKRLKQGGTPSSKSSKLAPAAKRGRGMSITGRSTIIEGPRSTTPSSVTSSSSRTKSPATPASSRAANRTRQGELGRRTRRTSAQTDISIHSESESDERSESDTELSRTRSGNRAEEIEPKTYRKKLVKTKGDKRKDDEDTEKEEEFDRPRRTKKFKKLSDIKPLDDSDDDNSSQPKGREFDLNQIRSELKGFGKAIKVASNENSEKEAASSDESITLTDLKDALEPEPEEKKEKEKEKPVEKPPTNSDDIYEFKEPEPFEFEARKIVDDKIKKRITRVFDDLEKSPVKKKPVPKSPVKVEEVIEKKRFIAKRMPVVKKVEESEEEEKFEKEEKKSDDPFDKLVESPSFHIGKSTAAAAAIASAIIPIVVEKEIVLEKSSVIKVLNLDEPLCIFDLPESMEESSEDRMELSDVEDKQTIIIDRTSPMFENFGKPSPDIDINFENKTELKKDLNSEDDEDPIRASIQRVFEQTNLTDDDSTDVLLANKTLIEFDTKPVETKPSTSSSTVTLNRVESEDDAKEEILEEKDKIAALPKQISAVFQETDSTFLENLYSSPQIITTKVEDLKDINVNVKTGTKIADSLLQKISMIKNSELKSEDSEDEVKKEEVVKSVEAVEPEPAPLKDPPISPESPKPEVAAVIELKKPEVAPPLPDFKKRTSKKAISREFIEDSDTDTDSDSERPLIIARSDEDSQNSVSMDNKVDVKETDSSTSTVPNEDDSQSQEEERNFKFDEIEKVEEPEPPAPLETKEDAEAKEEEPDSQLHSMLLCEETIPGSPAPPPVNEPKPKNKNVLEMPFASAPSSSNSKMQQQQQEKVVVKEKQVAPVPIVLPLENRAEVSTVLDNTPPTTPESTLSNLSPRGEIGGLSPNTGDNESCKSNEADVDFSTSSRRSLPSKSYSEDDSLLNSEAQSSSTKKNRDDQPSPCKKRRRSCKGDSSNDVPVKRGRKPNRSRHNSDSDDTSEHSMHAIGTNSVDTRLTRSPRPSKYNFYVEFDPALDSASRIAVLQQKLQDLRKTYAEVKAELVTIERRRKKIRRREREALKAAKQEMACT